MTSFVITGKPVLLVNGAYRGQEATIEKINEEKFSCIVTISSVSIIIVFAEFNMTIISNLMCAHMFQTVNNQNRLFTCLQGPLKGRVLDNVQYEDLSKLHVS